MESARRRIVTPVHAWVALAVMLVAALALSPARAAGRAPPATAATRDAPWSRGLLFAELVRHLVEDRSVQMAHRLFLPLRGGRVFVAVGALHLYGDRSLLALLRAQGYRVRRVHRGRRRAMTAGT